MTAAIAESTSLRLTPSLSQGLAEVIADRDLLQMLMQGFGSPFNVVAPQQLASNVSKCRDVLRDEPGLRHRLFLAHKPNRSGAVIRQAAMENIDLDVASEGELRSGLVNGFRGERIEATGPKNTAFLRLALQHRVVLNVDNHEELRQIEVLHRGFGLNVPAQVVLRLSGFRHNGRPLSSMDTKFGISVDDAPRILRWLVERPATFRLHGLAFHFTFSTGRERAHAVESLLDMHVDALRLGLTPEVVNIGGGFKVNFLDSAEEWNTYVSGIKAGLLAQGPSMSWNGAGFGMQAEGGQITGASNLASFAHTDLIESELGSFLDSPLRTHGGRRVGSFLAENGIELHLEPGRALYDQIGLTLARVNFVKRTVAGEWLVGLDMNRSNLDVTDREFFVDPIVINQEVRPPESVGVYFGGNLCLPGDLIFRHKTFLDRLPDAGDIVVFPNTAGYFMDFIESETLQQRIAPKVAVGRRGDRLEWWRDEDYIPALQPEGDVQ